MINEFVKAALAFATLLAIIAGAAQLQGCQAVKTVYDTCAEGLCR